MRRSHFLVHWTGKDISVNQHTLTDVQRDEYVGRLFSILAGGFWMSMPLESLLGGLGGHPGGSHGFTYSAAMTCFTEIRLSAASHHASQYGLLGIAVDRHFVLDRWGSPVHYVRNRSMEHIVGSFADLRYQLVTLLNRQGLDPQVDLLARNALQHADYLGVFLKAMSAPPAQQNDPDDFFFLDEQEWRVVAVPELLNKGHIVDNGKKALPPFKLVLPADKVRLIVAPDGATRNKLIADARIGTHWPNRIHPPILTLDECGEF